MARLLSQLAVDETVTIQETSGPQQYTVMYQNYNAGVSSNPSGLTMLLRNAPLRTTYGTDMSQITILNSFFSTVNEKIRNLVPSITYYVGDTKDAGGHPAWSSRAVTSQAFTLSGWHLRNLPLDNPSNDDICPGWNSTTFTSPPPALNATALWNALGTARDIFYSSFSTTYRNRFSAGYTSAIYYALGYPSSDSTYMFYSSTNASMSCNVFPAIAPYGNQIRVDDSGNLYVGPDNPASFINLPQIAMKGQTATIQWQGVSDATGYVLERSTDGGSQYTQVYSGANTSYTDTVGNDWASLQYRVKATNVDGESPYTVSADISLVDSSVLAISGTDGSLGTLTSDIHYTVSSNTGNQINLTRTVNGVVAASQTVDSGFSYDIPILELPSGDNNTIVISASVATTGNNVVNAVRNWTYSKTALEFPNDVGISTLTQNGENIYPMSTMEAIRTYGFMGGTLDKTLMELANAGKIMSGSYVGTGTYGPDNPTVIHFDVKPDIVFVYTTRGSITPLMAIIGEESSSYSNVNTKIFTNNSVDTRAQTKFENNEFSIVNDGGGYADEYQMNGAGYTYYYIGIAG